MAKDSTGTFLLIGAAGLAYYGYTQGWFSSLFGTSTAGSTTLTAAQLAAIQAAAGSLNPPPTASATPPPEVPALGTTVTNANQALQQVAANDAYILPDAGTFATLQTALPAGYNVAQTTDKGGILLRSDVYNALQTLIGNRVSKASAAGASLNSLQNASNVTLNDIQTMMSTQGLSGLGDYRRHLYSRTGRA